MRPTPALLIDLLAYGAIGGVIANRLPVWLALEDASEPEAISLGLAIEVILLLEIVSLAYGRTFGQWLLGRTAPRALLARIGAATGRTALAGALLLTIASTGALAGPFPFAHPALSFRDAARALIAAAPLGSDARVYGQMRAYPPRSVIDLVPDVGERIRRLPHEFTYVFVIDDEPTSRFAHPVRYALVPERGSVEVIAQQWLPTFNGREWQFDHEEQVDGRAVVALREEVRSAVAGPGVARDRSVSGGPRTAALANKVAVVVDGSDRRAEWEDRNSPRYEALRQQFLKDAVAMSDLLRETGSSVRLLTASGDRGSGAVTRAAVLEAIARAAADVSPGGELVLYLGGHGNENGFAVFGAGGKAELLGYRELAGRLRAALDPSVQVTVVIDACRAGAAIVPLDERPNTTVIAATGASGSAPGGVGNDRSFTEAIVEARPRAADLDRNGIIDVTESATRVVLQDPQFSRIGARIRQGVGVAVSPTPLPTSAAATPGATPPPALRTPTPTTPVATVATPRPATPPPTLVPATAPPAPAATPTLTPLPTLPGVGRITFTPPVLPAAVAGSAYTGPALMPHVRDGSPPYHFQLDTFGGFPPQGIVLAPDGVLSGTPAAATAGRTYPFVICAVDLAGTTACTSVSLAVSAPVATTPAATPVSFALAVGPRTCTTGIGSSGLQVYFANFRGTAAGPVGTVVLVQTSGVTTTCEGWGLTASGSCLRREGDPTSTQFTMQLLGTRRTQPILLSLDGQIQRSVAVDTSCF